MAAAARGLTQQARGHSAVDGAGAYPVKALSQNLEAVLEALRKAGVELPDENTIRLAKRRR